MEATQHSTGQDEHAGERYEAAREWLRFLIDHPDKTVSVAEYKAQLKAAMKAVQVAADRQAIIDYAQKVASEAPPLTPAQIDRVSAILNGGKYVASTATPERPEVTAMREAESKLAGALRAFTEAMAGCQGCGLSAKVHGYQKDYGLGFHDFVALTPADVITVAKFHGKKIAAAERALEKATS